MARTFSASFRYGGRRLGREIGEAFGIGLILCLVTGVIPLPKIRRTVAKIKYRIMYHNHARKLRELRELCDTIDPTHRGGEHYEADSPHCPDRCR